MVKRERNSNIPPRRTTKRPIEKQPEILSPKENLQLNLMEAELTLKRIKIHKELTALGITD
jgi:hypothetical protein